MNEIARDLSSPTWWFTVVVAGFLVNVVAAYAKAPIDRLADQYARRRHESSAARRQRVDSTVDYLLANPTELVDLKLESITRILTAIFAVVLAIFGFFVTQFAMGVSDLPEAVATAGTSAYYLVASVAIMLPVREYFDLRRVLSAYSAAAHTVVSRYRDNTFPAA